MKFRISLVLVAMLSVVVLAAISPSTSQALCPITGCPLTRLPPPVKWVSTTEAADGNEEANFLPSADPDSPGDAVQPPYSDPDPLNRANPFMIVPDGGDPDAAIIYSLQPQQGCHGAIIAVTGNNFTGKGNESQVNDVEFNGSGASFSIQSATLMYVQVPAGAIDGRIRTHQLWKPDGVSDVIVYSEQSFDVLDCSQNGGGGGGGDQYADPSFHISPGDLTSSDSLITAGSAHITASMNWKSLDWQYQLGQARGANFMGIYSGDYGTLINTGRVFDTPSISASVFRLPCCVIQPPKLLQQSLLKVKGKFTIAGQTRVVNKKARVQRNIDVTGAKIVQDTPFYTLYIVPPYFMAEFLPLRAGGDRVTSEGIISLKKGTLVSGTWLFSMDNGGLSGEIHRSATFKPGSKGEVTWVNARTTNDFLGTWAWNARVLSGSISIKDTDGGVHVFNLATGFTTSLVKASFLQGGTTGSAHLG